MHSDNISNPQNAQVAFFNRPKLPWILIGVGIALRLAEFLANRSLWLDEAGLALNIIERSFAGLLRPLDHHQAAPLGFLMLEKLMVQTFGDSEYALRLIPFLSGILSLFLFYAVAKRCLSSKGLVIALALFATAEPLISFSSQVKQYSSDVVIALFITLLALVQLDRDRLETRGIALLGLSGALCIWVSHPSLFVVMGAGLTLILADLARNKSRNLARLSLIFFLCASSFAVTYVISLQRLVKSQYFVSGWENMGAFMPLPPSSFSDIRWFATKFFEVFAFPVGLSLSGLAALFFILGCSSMLSKSKVRFLVLISPILFTLLASGLHKYPFGNRLLLFLVPCALLLVGEGVAKLMDVTWHNTPLIASTATALLFFHPLFYAGYHLVTPPSRSEEIKPVLSFLKEHREPGDVLYVYYRAHDAFRYYQKRFGLAETDYILGVNGRGYMRDYFDDLDQLRGHERVWILFSHIFASNGDEEDLFRYYLDSMGKRRVSFKSHGASIYLYDLSPRAPKAQTAGDIKP